VASNGEATRLAERLKEPIPKDLRLPLVRRRVMCLAHHAVNSEGFSPSGMAVFYRKPRVAAILSSSSGRDYKTRFIP
jgi:hypothetical protein